MLVTVSNIAVFVILDFITPFVYFMPIVPDQVSMFRTENLVS